ncbi:hypothetical protein L1987_66072 [Smallanthus sonchifolius]|uniref:Uncharacterized protein n=1 Tax=Smallanthus sonchifolius TaxID=185202 RepID=A0ACB9BW99_9ASTR|nr:hypothetical protein L1987_66072 [Smallanthus sonchifolius]
MRAVVCVCVVREAFSALATVGTPNEEEGSNNLFGKWKGCGEEGYNCTSNSDTNALPCKVRTRVMIEQTPMWMHRWHVYCISFRAGGYYY